MTALLAALLAFSPPAVQQWRIPFPQQRKAEMRAYARRHYGINSYTLTKPKVIVEHVAVAASAAATRDVFVPDRPDPELHELPGVCSHFVVDRDGTIYQLVSLKLMCRHTVGLNYTAIGIEHAGFNDGDVLGGRLPRRWRSRRPPPAGAIAAPEARAQVPVRQPAVARDRPQRDAVLAVPPR